MPTMSKLFELRPNNALTNSSFFKSRGSRIIVQGATSRSAASCSREKEALFAKHAAEGLKEAPRANAELMISILGLSDFFQLIVRSKPFPDPYLRALALLGASPDHTVVFEDSTIGVQAGASAGMPVIAIADERREGKLLAVHAAPVIRDYQDPKLWEAVDKTDTER